MLFLDTYLRPACAIAISTLGFSAYSLASPPSVPSAYKNQASAFVENRGQWDSRVQFMSQTPGINQWVTSEGVVLDFNRYAPDAKASPTKTKNGHIEGHVVKMSFVNAAPSATTGVGEFEGKNNYLIGNDQSKWTTGARRFAEARAEQPYNGISVRYYVDQGSPRYDLIVKPGADPSPFGLKIEGANGLRVLDNGDLAINTSLGTVEEKGLTAYQVTAVGKTPISCRMITDGSTVRFDIGSYDPSKPLIIDPLVYSTFLGGTNGYETTTGLAVTPSDKAVVCGYTDSTNFPTSTGAYQKSRTTIDAVATVVELNSTGTGVVFATYLGGSVAQDANGVAVDSSGNPVIVGWTDSNDFPETTGSYQSTNVAWPNSTSFITKLNATGTGLVFGSMFGASDGATVVQAVALDSNGNVLVGGFSNANNFPTTAGALQKTAPDNDSNFVSKFNSNCSSLLYSTFLGSQADTITAVAFDKAGYAYVAGNSSNGDLPTTAGAYQTAIKVASPYRNGFILKLNANASALVYGTYLGGTTDDYVGSLAVDSLGNAIVCGDTYSRISPPPSAPTKRLIKHQMENIPDLLRS